MDNFRYVYDSFYNVNSKPGADIIVDGKPYKPVELGLKKLPRGAVEVVALFDTVG
jgi:hypothetical protein